MGDASTWNKLLTYVGVSPTIVARVDFGQPQRRQSSGGWHGRRPKKQQQWPERKASTLLRGLATGWFLDSSSQKNPRWRPPAADSRQAGVSELEDLIGVIVHKGTRHGIPTPVTCVCYMTLKPYEMGAPSPTPGVVRAEPEDEPDWYSAALHTSRLSTAFG